MPITFDEIVTEVREEPQPQAPPPGPAARPADHDQRRLDDLLRRRAERLDRLQDG